MEGTIDDEDDVGEAEEDGPARVEENEDDEGAVVIGRIPARFVTIYKVCRQAEFGCRDRRDEEEQEGMIAGH